MSPDALRFDGNKGLQFVSSAVPSVTIIDKKGLMTMSTGNKFAVHILIIHYLDAISTISVVFKWVI